MLIAALVMAVIGLAALVTAVVTSNEVIAWVCIGASAIGVLLLIVDAVRERQRRESEAAGPATKRETPVVDDPVEPEPDAEPATAEEFDLGTYDGGQYESGQFDAEYPDETVDTKDRER